MAKHIFKGEGAPTFAPRQVGHHYIDTLNEISYISTGMNSSADWKAFNASVTSVNGQDAIVQLDAEDIPNTPAGNIAATNVQTALNELDTEKQAVSEKGMANGYAGLDGSGKVPVAQLPDTVVGAVDYKGTWNANTNTPNIGAGSPDKGDYYVVNVAGATSLGGITDWKIGDWAIYNGTAWEKVDNTDQVTSVFGRQGVVVAQTGDYTATQVSSTAPAGYAGTNVQANINEIAALSLAHASRHLPSGADPLTTAAPAANLSSTTTNATGSANSLARSDHSHAIATGTPSTQNADQSNAAGSSANLAKADHVHNIPTAAASALTTSSTNTQGSAGTFSKSDHTHQVSIINDEAIETATTTTTSGTDVLMNSMTLTPVAGTYMVWFSSTFQSSSSNANIFFSIYVGGVQKADSERSVQPRVDASGGLGGNNNLTINLNGSTNGKVTVNGAQAIEIRWRRSAGTASALQRTLNIIKLSN